MVQKLGNLDKWWTLDEGQAFTLRGSRVRTIRLDVNAPERARIFATVEGGEPRFVAHVLGRDTIEFVAGGNIDVSCEGAAIDVYTMDGEDISAVNQAPEIFTKILERRRRSPELEAVMQAMNANMERRLAQQSRELEQLFVRRERARAAQLAAPPRPGAPPSAPGQNGRAGSSGAQTDLLGGGRDAEPGS